MGADFRMNKPWNSSELAQLLKLAAAGATNAEIGRILGRSRESIKKKVRVFYAK